MELTDEQRELYLKHNGEKCPFCGSDDITDDITDYYVERYGEVWKCKFCDAYWNNIYSLKGVDIISGPYDPNE